MITQLFHHVGQFFGMSSATKSGKPGAVEASGASASASGVARDNRRPAVHQTPVRSPQTRNPGLETRSQSTARLLADGRLQIAVTGFHDTAFEISPLERHDSAPLSGAVADLPCCVKMVDDRNILDALSLGLNALDARGEFGRRAIVLVTSGISSSKLGQLIELASEAAARRIGVHVICLGADADTFAAGREICTKHLLGYGYCRAAETPEELDLALRYALGGLTPVFGMRGTNRATILVDCSETMVASYRDTTRCEMAIGAIQGFLGSPLFKRNQATSSNGNLRNKSEIRGLPSFRSQEAYEWTPGVA